MTDEENRDSQYQYLLAEKTRLEADREQLLALNKRLRDALREIATKSPIRRSVVGEGMQISTACGQCMDIIAIADKALATEAVRLSEIKEK